MAEDVEAAVEAWVARTLAEAPPITPEVRARLARLLAGGGGGVSVG